MLTTVGAEPTVGFTKAGRWTVSACTGVMDVMLGMVAMMGAAAVVAMTAGAMLAMLETTGMDGTMVDVGIDPADPLTRLAP